MYALIIMLVMVVSACGVLGAALIAEKWLEQGPDRPKQSSR